MTSPRPVRGIVWRAKIRTRIKLTVTPSFGFTPDPRYILDRGQVGMSLPPTFAFTDQAISSGAVTLTVAPQIAGLTPNTGMGSILLTLTPAISFDGEARIPSEVAVSVPPALSFTAEAVRTGFPYTLPFTVDDLEITAAQENSNAATVNALADGSQPIPDSVMATADTVHNLSAGVHVYTGSTAAEWVLPAASTMGTPILVFNRGSGLLTVQRAGTDTILTDSGAVLSIALTTGRTTQFVSDGTYWLTGE